MQQTKFKEQLGTLFFDADKDRNLDLYGSSYFQDKLYRHDGKDNFTVNAPALPHATRR